MRVAMITPWGVRCGIAAYSRSLVESVRGADIEFLILCEYDTPQEDTDLWTTRGCWRRYSNDVADLVQALDEVDVDVVHVQLQWFHAGEVMREMLEAALRTGCPVVVQFHNTLPSGSTQVLEELADTLARSACLVAHSDADAARLASVGLQSLVTIMPLGQAEYPLTTASDVRRDLGLSDRSPVVGTFGYLLPHKGVLETVRAVGLLRSRYPDILYIAACSLYPHQMSLTYLQECRFEIIDQALSDNVMLITDFLPEEVAMTVLMACDVLALPYQPTTESASAAIRFALSAHRPTVVTDQEIFRSIGRAVHPIVDASPEAIASGLERVLSDPGYGDGLVHGGFELLESAGWTVIGVQYQGILAAALKGRVSATIDGP